MTWAYTSRPFAMRLQALPSSSMLLSRSTMADGAASRRSGTARCCVLKLGGWCGKLPLQSALKIRLTGETAPAAQLRGAEDPPGAATEGNDWFIRGRHVCDDCAGGLPGRGDPELAGGRIHRRRSTPAETTTRRRDASGDGRARDLSGTKRYYRSVIVPSTASGPGHTRAAAARRDL